MLKNFHRVDILQKNFNTKILQHRSREERTESNCHGKVFQKKLHLRLPRIATVKKYGRRRLERRWCMCEREPKISSDRYTVAVKNEGTIVEHLL